MVNFIHPAGLFIFVAILVLSVALKKAFCSWLCPTGTLSESLWMPGNKLLGRNLQLTKWLDYPLRSLKYLLLLFFLCFFLQVDVSSPKAFIESPYNRMADVKMYFSREHLFVRIVDHPCSHCVVRHCQEFLVSIPLPIRRAPGDSEHPQPTEDHAPGVNVYGLRTVYTRVSLGHQGS